MTCFHRFSRTIDGVLIKNSFRLPRSGFHHVVHADDRDADYDVGGVE